MKRREENAVVRMLHFLGKHSAITAQGFSEFYDAAADWFDKKTDPIGNAVRNHEAKEKVPTHDEQLYAAHMETLAAREASPEECRAYWESKRNGGQP